tara:strand:- start:11 stop:346 length:336 start_codon:yes stop_codon:yes gene_type:complete
MLHKLHKSHRGTAYFSCPACNSIHFLRIEGKRPWQFNGDYDNPTLSPSIKVVWPANPDAAEEFKEWRTERVCHSQITDGDIMFYGDSTHDKAGMTMRLPVIEENPELSEKV